MTERARRVLRDALSLSARDRANIAAELLASLEGGPDENVEAAWATELERRARAALKAPAGGEPWEEVRDQLRGELDGK